MDFLDNLLGDIEKPPERDPELVRFEKEKRAEAKKRAAAEKAERDALLVKVRLLPSTQLPDSPNNSPPPLPQRQMTADIEAAIADPEKKLLQFPPMEGSQRSVMLENSENSQEEEPRRWLTCLTPPSHPLSQPRGCCRQGPHLDELWRRGRVAQCRGLQEGVPNWRAMTNGPTSKTFRST